MPALVLFERKFRIASDDFVLPAIWSASIRFLVLVAAVVVYFTEHSFHECPGGQVLAVFMIGLAVLLSITILLEFTIAFFSAHGSILAPGRRRFVPVFLYIRLAVLGIEVIWSGVAAFWILQEWDSEGDKGCDLTIIRLVKTSLFCFWALIFLLLVVVWLLFEPSPKEEEEDGPRDGSGSHGSRHLRRVAKSNWHKRCQWLCCFAGKDDNLEAAYADAAEILSHLFGTFDIVPSDVAAGFVLMQLEQQRRICRGESLSHHRFSLPSDVHLPTAPLAEVLDPVVYYFKYSAAMYGWPYFMESNVCCGACRLFPLCRCCSCVRTDLLSIEKDNCCRCNTSSIFSLLDVDEDDIIYISFHNKIYEVPFMVLIDRGRKSIVVAIRGTLSLKDALTDVTADAQLVDIAGHDDIYAHKGMVCTARFLCNKIKELRLLEEAKSREPDFPIVFTGHSLGAGAAILTSSMLKDEWPGIKCYAYASPFGLLNAEGVHFTKDFVVSVVLGLDIIPRLSIQTVNDLRDQVVEVMQHSPTPKYRILLGGCWYSICGLPKLLPDPGVKAPLLGSPIKKPKELGKIEGGGDSYTEEQGQLELPRPPSPTPSEGRMQIELYPGGSLIWIREADEERPRGWCQGPSSYRAQWATYKEFDHIVISPYMVTDHLPRTMNRAINWVAEHMEEVLDIHLTAI